METSNFEFRSTIELIPFVVRYETENKSKQMHSFQREFYRGDLSLSDQFDNALEFYKRELDDHHRMIDLGVYRWAKVQLISPFGDVMRSVTLINDLIQP